MAVTLAEKFLPYVDEQFKAESKKSLLTNQDFNWTGAHTVKIYKISTAAMTDYGRTGPTGTNWSRYGAVAGLDAATEELTLSRDRSFTFAIDAMDADETGQTLTAASALARQLREVVIPEIDGYVFGKMCTGAGTKPAAAELTAANIYGEILKAGAALDAAEVPEAGRQVLLAPETLLLMEQSGDIVLETDIGADLRLNGVISNLDGATVIRVPASRVPEGFGFLLAHPSATVAPVKLESYNTHQNPPGINGQLVEGRVVYDAFVLENKKMALYYQAVPTEEA